MKLVTHWKLWWRRWSTWVAALYAAGSAVMFANPTILIGLVAYVPHREFAAGILFVLLFALPVLITQLRQPKLAAKVEELRAKGS